MKGWTERDLRNNLGSVLQTRWGGTETTDEDLKVEALKLSHLADAVAWVREKTQNDHMCSDVCSDAELSDLGPNARVYLLAPIYAFCRHIYSDPSRFMREQWYRYLPAHGRHGAFVFLPSGSLDEWNPWQIPRGTRVLDVLSIMLLRRTDTVVGKVISIDADAEGYGTELMHALISALCFLYHAIKIIPTSTLFNEFVGFLVSLHNRLADPREPYDELFPSLRTFCVQVIQHLGSIEFIEHEICGALPIVIHCLTVTKLRQFSEPEVQEHVVRALHTSSFACILAKPRQDVPRELAPVHYFSRPCSDKVFLSQSRHA